MVNFARRFLNYLSFSSVFVENDADDNSVGRHWVHMILATDFMNLTDTFRRMISELSLSMAPDSCWFDIDTRFVESLEYGKGAGIDIQTDDCPTTKIRGFCINPRELSYGPECKSNSRCYSDEEFSEGCLFKYADVHCSIEENYCKDVDLNI